MLKHPLAKPLFFIFCLLPLLWIVANAVFGDLGANPVETVTHQTGDWALRLLLLTLLLTPLKNWTGNPQWIRFRRMAGLFVYFYAFCHFSIWYLADHGLDVLSMLNDIKDRPYITLGFTAFVLLTPLALTSNRWMMKKLGKHWKSLHRLVYLILVLVIAHYLWLVKADYREPIVYALIGGLLLLLRLPVIRQNLLYKQGVS
ncbi:MAG: protein-methionine-sulfoxide reductase heme-binding subunit MsrQ [Gammaproteobacteria bacterium]|nr:protein-methionine-sulfoxide reductase heme-binding subunit MsrQ [Gammaproteobacteria bacterium]